MINPFFDISEKNKCKLLKLLECQTFTYNKGDYINKTITNENIIGIVISGLVKIAMNDLHGNSITLDEISENELFSTELNVVAEDASILCLEDTEIIIITYDALLHNIENEKIYFNRFIKNLLIIYNERLKRKNERIKILSRKTIRDKLLSYFQIEFSKTNSRNIYLPFNYNDLANYLSVDRSAMSRELGSLKKEGFISTKGKRITLLYK